MAKEDLEISAISYTKKDFASIYPEMLDVAKQLTNKWDPSQSNESDPGVVLLKEAAFVADHNNYNIDKNILENFLPSATQETSVRNICEMNGYVPKYYVSATGMISFKYENTGEDKEELSFTVPAFTMVISDADESVSYTQIEDLVINIDPSTPGKSIGNSSCKFIEGTLQKLTVNNYDVIRVNNLDDNNRLYFPETMVAQNGIYVRYKNETDHQEYGFWSRNDYILTQPSGSRIYKIDFDSKVGLPYIEFPSDISNIIRDGLVITYISTSGYSGNIGPNKLTNILSPTEAECLDIYGIPSTKSLQYFSLTNSGNIANGKDPETIDEMYRSFKKVVGTFETLVSCKDYSNEIYEMVDSYDNPIISNVYVTDRRNDYNKSLNVLTFDNNGQYFKNVSIGDNVSLVYKGEADISSREAVVGYMYSYSGKLFIWTGIEWKEIDNINVNDFVQLSGGMTPYDLSIYALSKYSEADYTNLYPNQAIDYSFKPANSETLSLIKTNIENCKCICHTYKDATDNDIFCFKNYAPLNITITPYNKVTMSERSSILSNIYKALSENFNPRGVDWGVPLEKDDIDKAILACDDRIRKVEIQQINYNTKFMLGDGDEKSIDQASGGEGNYYYIVDVIAKNILAGRLCLFDFDDRFSYEYGQKNGMIVDKISTDKGSRGIRSEAKIKLFNPLKTEKSVTSNTTTKISNIQGSDSEKLRYVLYIYNNTSGTRPIGEGSYINLGSTRVSETKTVTDMLYVQTGRYDESGKFVVTSTGTYYASPERSIKIENTGCANFKAIYCTKTMDTPKEPDFTVINSSDKFTIEEVTINYTDSELPYNLKDYELQDNEVVQIIYPNYYAEKTYGLYVNYRYEGSSVLKANTENVIQAGSRLILNYSKGGETTEEILTDNTIVKPSFDIVPTDTLSSSGVKKSWTDENGVLHDDEVFKTLTSNQTISTEILMETILKNAGYRCYWIINSDPNGENRLFEQGVNTRILNSGEYFIYGDSNLNEIMILGCGTKIVRQSLDDEDQWLIDDLDLVSIDNITTNGTSSSIPWQTMDFSNSKNLHIIEMNVITLGKGDTISVKGVREVPEGDNKYCFSNEWISPTKEWCKETGDTWLIEYTPVGKSPVSITSKSEDYYWVRSRLDINSGNDIPQVLHEGIDDLGRTCVVDTIFVKNEPIKAPLKIQSNPSLSLVGGDNIDLSYFNNNKLPISLFIYEDGLSVSDTVFAIDVDTGEDIGGNRRRMKYPFYFNPKDNSGIDAKDRIYLIPIYIQNNVIKVYASLHKVILKDDGTYDIGDMIKFADFNNNKRGYDTDLYELEGDTLYFITPDSTTVEEGVICLVLEWDRPTETSKPEIVYVNDFRVQTGLNSMITTKDYSSMSKKDPKTNLNAVLTRINDILESSDKPNTKFYYTYEPDNSMAIDLEKWSHWNQELNGGDGGYDSLAFDNPEVFWDKNNVANHMTIPEIDLISSQIDIEKSMRNY